MRFVKASGSMRFTSQRKMPYKFIILHDAKNEKSGFAGPRKKAERSNPERSAHIPSRETAQKKDGTSSCASSSCSRSVSISLSPKTAMPFAFKSCAVTPSPGTRVPVKLPS